MPDTTPVEGWILPENDPENEPEGAQPPAPRRRRTALLLGAVPLLAVALALALAATAVLGVLVYRDRHVDAGTASALAAVERYRQMLDQHDLAGLEDVLSDQGTFAAGENLRSPMVGPFTGPELTRFYRHLFGAGFRISTDGPAVVTGGGAYPYRVAVPQKLHYVVAGVTVDERSLSLYTVVLVGGRALVAEHVWWRPLHAVEPSLLWTMAP